MVFNKKPCSKICIVCKELWKREQISVRCSKCKYFVHGPSGKKSCSLLSIDDYKNLTESLNLNQWQCPSCVAHELPFCILTDNELITQFHHSISNPLILPGPHIQSFMDKCNIF